jgi:vacuolar-type H+-ATPase subunit C/Vma6
MSTPKPLQGTGDLTTFNIQHGFAEALLRGMRSSFLADTDYHHLTQCETLDDVRLNLSETDYAEPLADYNSLTPNTLQKVAVNKVCKQNLIEWTDHDLDHLFRNIFPPTFRTGLT